MPDPLSPPIDDQRPEGHAAREARPILGWPLHKLAQLDRGGARGLVADLAHAGALSRQAAYIAVAYADLDAPAEFLHRLAIGRDDRADRLPMPIRAADGIRPLRTAVEYAELGARMKNCATTKLAEVALGLLAVVEATHRGADGTETAVAVSLTPTMDGQWMVSELNGARNRRPSPAVMRDVLLRLQALGVIIPGPQLGDHYRPELADTVGVFRWRSLDDALHGVDDEDDPFADIEADIEAA